ncbi:MAG: hypothetical protein LIP09_12290 [Bacteroidales bacterium]|nr:hypothetical protein [Bacteroidales bacterium]
MNKVDLNVSLLYELGKYLLDISKLTFAGVILGVLFEATKQGNISYSSLFVGGFVAMGLLLATGFTCMKVSKILMK